MRPANVKILFVFSPPRSGSSALQRALSLSPSLYSAPESWLLIPLLQPFRGRGCLADWDARMQAEAQERFLGRTKGGPAAYRRRLAEAFCDTAGDLQGRGSAQIFVEKVPRNSLFAELILEAFPDSYFLFLYRNPLHVVASMITTWSGGKAWPRSSLYVDLFEGWQASLAAHESALVGRSRSVRYEDLCERPAETLGELWSWLGAVPSSTADELPVLQEAGDPGDPNFGTDSVPLLQRHPELPPLRGGPRERSIHALVESFSPEQWQIMGYDRSTILDELASTDRVDLGTYFRDLRADLRSRAARRILGSVTSNSYRSGPLGAATPR